MLVGFQNRCGHFTADTRWQMSCSCWESNSVETACGYSAARGLSCLLVNPEVQYLIHKILPAVSILSQMHPFNIFVLFLLFVGPFSYFLLTFPNSLFLLSHFSSRVSVAFLVLPMRARSTADFMFLYLFTPKLLGQQYRLWTSWLWNLVSTVKKNVYSFSFCTC